MKHDAYIFDVDGVLIDTSSSFSHAVVLAVEKATGSSKFQQENIQKLKRIAGFNNDWDVAITGAAWITYLSEMSFDGLMDSLDKNGSGMESLKIIIPSLSESFKQNITKLTMEAYGGISACKQLYGFNPESIFIHGKWKNETSFLNKNDIKQLLPKSGIVTGRNKTEMDLAFQILGWHIPMSRVSVSDDPKLDKPNPTKLMQIIKVLDSQSPIYFGDSIDDYYLVKNFKKETGNQMDFCCVGNQNGLPEFDFQINNIRDYFINYGVKS